MLVATEGRSPVRLLVTGGVGYVGSVVSSLLVEEGHEARIFRNLSKRSRLKTPTTSRPKHYVRPERLTRLLVNESGRFFYTPPRLGLNRPDEGYERLRAMSETFVLHAIAM